MLTAEQMEALKQLGKATRGTFDPWDIMGPHNLPIRRAILSGFLGRKTNNAESGVMRIRQVLWALAGKSGTYREEEKVFDWARREAAGEGMAADYQAPDPRLVQIAREEGADRGIARTVAEAQEKEPRQFNLWSEK